MDNKQLCEYGDEHINYEINMLVQTHLTLSTPKFYKLSESDPDLFWVAKNSLIESRAMHFRNLHDFLKHDGHKQRHELNSIIAKDYNNTYNFTQNPLLSRLSKQCDDHIAHLTDNRVSDKEQELGLRSKTWIHMIPGIPEILKQFKIFIDQLPLEKRPKILEKTIIESMKILPLQ